MLLWAIPLISCHPPLQTPSLPGTMSWGDACQASSQHYLAGVASMCRNEPELSAHALQTHMLSARSEGAGASQPPTAHTCMVFKLTLHCLKLPICCPNSGPTSALTLKAMLLTWWPQAVLKGLCTRHASPYLVSSLVCQMQSVLRLACAVAVGGLRERGEAFDERSWAFRIGSQCSGTRQCLVMPPCLY